MLKRKNYSSEFKRGAVEQAHPPSVSCAQVTRKLGIELNLLSRWKREAGAVGLQAFVGIGNPRGEEVTRLRRELARMKKGRDFLREAAAFFARESSGNIRRFNVTATNSPFV